MAPDKSCRKENTAEVTNTTNYNFSRHEDHNLSHSGGNIYSQNENKGTGHYGDSLNENAYRSDQDEQRPSSMSPKRHRSGEIHSSRRSRRKRQRTYSEDDDEPSSPQATNSRPRTFSQGDTKDMAKRLHRTSGSYQPGRHVSVDLNRIELDRGKLPYEIRHSSWFCQGRVFRITEEAEDSFIRGRTLIVIGQSMSASICLSLCGHPDITGKESSWFFESHIPLHSADAKAAKRLRDDQWSSIEIEMLSDRRLKSDTWTNCEHLWTIMHCVRVAAIGQVEGPQLKELLQNSVEIFVRMTRRQNVF